MLKIKEHTAELFTDDATGIVFARVNAAGRIEIEGRKDNMFCYFINPKTLEPIQAGHILSWCGDEMFWTKEHDGFRYALLGAFEPTIEPWGEVTYELQQIERFVFNETEWNSFMGWCVDHCEV